MLALANTKEGKDLLCIEDYGLPIIGMRKNAVLYDQGDKWMADFRVGAKWGNVVRYRWQEIKRALDRMNELALLKAMQVGVPAGAATLTAYPDADEGTTSADGIYYREVSSENISTIVGGAGTGGRDNSATDTFVRVGAHSTTDNYTIIIAAAFLFDTSAIAGGEVSAAVFSLYGAAGSSDNMSQSIYLTLSAPASNINIVPSDYANRGRVAQSDSPIDISTFAVGSYNAWTLNSTGEGNVSTDGITKLGCSITADFNTDDSAWASGQTGDEVCRMAEIGGTTNDPKLVVTYTPSPFTPKAIMF